MMGNSATSIKDQKSLFSEILGAMTKKILEESKHLLKYSSFFKKKHSCVFIFQNCAYKPIFLKHIFPLNEIIQT